MEDDQKAGARKETGAAEGLQENPTAGNRGEASAGQSPPGGTMVFSFQDRTVRTVLKDGATWFVAADVCAVLEYSNSRQAVLAHLEDDERGVTIIDTLGGAQHLVVINESGLYRLVLTSRKSQAKAFRRWVTGEVLPSIRKTGRYEGSGEATGAPPRQDGNGAAVHVAIPHYGRFVVMYYPDRGPHVRETPYREVGATDCTVLAHQIGLVECYWQKFQQINAIGVDPRGGFAFRKLEESIREGGRLGRHFLRCYVMSQD